MLRIRIISINQFYCIQSKIAIVPRKRNVPIPIELTPLLYLFFKTAIICIDQFIIFNLKSLLLRRKEFFRFQAIIFIARLIGALGYDRQSTHTRENRITTNFARMSRSVQIELISLLYLLTKSVSLYDWILLYDWIRSDSC